MSFVRRSEKYGAGFFVNVEGMHHLHCLVSQWQRLSMERMVLTIDTELGSEIPLLQL